MTWLASVFPVPLCDMNCDSELFALYLQEEAGIVSVDGRKSLVDDKWVY
jgi:hypothetical protein